MLKRIAALAGATCMFGLGSANAQTSVCVEVELRSWEDLDLEAQAREEEPEQEASPRTVLADEALNDGEAVAEDNIAHDETLDEDDDFDDFDDEEVYEDDEDDDYDDESRAPAQQGVFVPPHYLRRLIEYRVTHMPGFEAVQEDCTQRLVVQLYPLPEGWTAFARYDGTSREEKVDRVQVDEFPALAARLTAALLNDRSLEETLSRRTVLRADSEETVRRVRGRTQVRFSIGTQIILGLLPTARSFDTPADHTFRASAPLALDAGARTTYRAWALDASLGMLVGTARQSVSGAGTGHADYTFGMTAALHFLRYISPDAAASLYGGGGASFQIHRYRVLPGPLPGSDEGLVGGGLNLDLVIGYEVMRASALSFFVEVQALLPAYGFDSENRNGSIRAWLPAGVVQIGLLR